MSTSIEAVLSALEARLSESEKQAAAATSRLKRLRRLAAAGDIGGLVAQLAQAPEAADRLGQTLREARAEFAYDAEAAFADGAYLAELRAEADRQGLVLIERDGRLSAFPLLLKLDAKAPGVKVGRKMQRAIRPAPLVKTLRAMQQASRFNATAFLEQIWSAYAPLAREAQAGWRPDAGSDGPAVPLIRVHELLTLLPVAAAEYPREAFACDLLRLNRAPDTRTARGFGFDLPASTGSKGRDRLTVYDERGAEHIFVGIRFLAPVAAATAAAA
jgi:hypothetical protein